MHAPERLAAVALALPVVVQVVRAAGLPARWAPVLAVALGVAASLAYLDAWSVHEALEAVLEGIVLGAAAVGIHERVRARVAGLPGEGGR